MIANGYENPAAFSLDARYIMHTVPTLVGTFFGKQNATRCYRHRIIHNT